VLPWLAATLVLTACGTGPTRQPRAEAPHKPGGYYLDDGPHANPPADLHQVPDAQPKPEPIRAANARPYTAMGRTYVPMTELGEYRAIGLASWYGKRYHGRQTASGEIYDMYAMTAAHPTLPIPSYARVRSLSTERSVVVRINDRGPFHSDRLIDLSYTAAYKLGILANGSAMVEVQSILPAADRQPVPVRRGAPSALPTAAVTPPASPTTEDATGVYIQLGAFSLRENAATLLTRLQAEVGWLAELAAIYPSGGMYRVQAGPYASREEALQAAARIEQNLDLTPVVITR
jgi:rare lipoprotein A